MSIFDKKADDNPRVTGTTGSSAGPGPFVEGDPMRVSTTAFVRIERIVRIRESAKFFVSITSRSPALVFETTLADPPH